MGISEFDRLRPPIASAAHQTVHVFVRDLDLEAVIGVHRHEKRRPQPIRVNIDLTTRAPRRALRDSLANVVDYEWVVGGVRALIAEGHVRLVETLAERIAQVCLENPRVLAARVRVEKLNAIEGAASVGVEIERAQGADAGGVGAGRAK